ncbi:conserved unknown protein (Partial), partial [Ectocarpus siliculosus]
MGQSTASEGSLSGLFRRVVTVCQNQFAVIGQVFPPPLVAKVTRLLLSRILNDPVYGVQARVEQVLSPQAPMEPLPLADYLNCLCTVEQQTAALFGMLKARAVESVACVWLSAHFSFFCQRPCVLLIYCKRHRHRHTQR